MKKVFATYKVTVEIPQEKRDALDDQEFDALVEKADGAFHATFERFAADITPLGLSVSYD